MEKAELKAREDELADMVTKFCKEHINDDYADACERMVRKIGRKRSQPLARGKLNIWAATIVYTVGVTSFLFDRTRKPYLPAETIRHYFGDVPQATITSKGKQIRDMLGMRRYWDPEFSAGGGSLDSPDHEMEAFMTSDAGLVVIHRF